MKTTELCKAYAERELKRYEENYYMMDAKFQHMEKTIADLELENANLKFEIDLFNKSDAMQKCCELQKECQEREIWGVAATMEIDKLRAENIRLREALKQIAAFDTTQLNNKPFWVVMQMDIIATKALKADSSILEPTEQALEKDGRDE